MAKPITQKAKSSPFKQTAGDILNEETSQTGVKATRSTSNTELIKGQAGVAGKPGKVIGSYKNKMSNDAWKEYLANETPEQKAKRHAREVADGVREAATPATPATPDVEITTTRKEEFTPEVYREQTQTTPWENRWANRVRKQQRRVQESDARQTLRHQAIEYAKRAEGDLGDKFKTYRSTMRGENLSEADQHLYDVAHRLTPEQKTTLDVRGSKAGYEQMGMRNETVKFADKFKNVDFSSAEGASAKERIEAGTNTTVTPEMKVTEQTTKTEVKEQPEAVAQMRYEHNVGMKSKSPLKKGYFK